MLGKESSVICQASDLTKKLPKLGQEEVKLQWTEGDMLSDLFAGLANAVQASGQMDQLPNLPRTPPRASRTHVAASQLLGTTNHCAASEPGNTAWRLFSLHG